MNQDLSMRDSIPPTPVVEAKNLHLWRISWHETAGRIHHINTKQDDDTYRSAINRHKTVYHINEQEVSVPNGTFFVTFKTLQTKGLPSIEPTLLLDFEPSDGEADINHVGISLTWGVYTTYVEAELGKVTLDPAEIAHITDHPLNLQIKTIN